MKRSAKIMTTTVLTGAVFALSACQEEQNQAMNFSGAAQCYQQRPSDVGFSDWRQICDDAEENATEAHEAEAPRYALSGSDGDDLCEEVHGDDQCYRISDNSGNSWFVPFMAGYVVSSMMDNSGSRYYGYSNSRPLYRTSSGGYTNSNFKYTTSRLNSTTAVRTNPTSYRAPTKPKTYSAVPAASKMTSTSIRSTGGFGASSTRSVSSRSSSFGG